MRGISELYVEGVSTLLVEAEYKEFASKPDSGEDEEEDADGSNGVSDGDADASGEEGNGTSAGLFVLVAGTLDLIYAIRGPSGGAIFPLTVRGIIASDSICTIGRRDGCLLLT